MTTGLMNRLMDDVVEPRSHWCLVSVSDAAEC